LKLIGWDNDTLGKQHHPLRNQKQNRIMKRNIVLPCLLAVLSSSLAMAVPQNGKGPRNIDSDGDGAITKAEAERAGATRILENFADIDTDNNGELTRDELRAHKQKRMEERRGKAKEADSDGNRAISKNEAEAAGMKRLLKKFDEIDANSDGEVTRKEMQNFRKAKGGKGSGQGKGQGQGKGPNRG
jgi:Ca2+-binding EF-hand superfamily protein